MIMAQRRYATGVQPSEPPPSSSGRPAEPRPERCARTRAARGGWRSKSAHHAPCGVFGSVERGVHLSCQLSGGDQLLTERAAPSSFRNVSYEAKMMSQAATSTAAAPPAALAVPVCPAQLSAPAPGGRMNSPGQLHTSIGRRTSRCVRPWPSSWSREAAADPAVFCRRRFLSKRSEQGVFVSWARNFCQVSGATA
jgi:hypothetical protein